MPSAPAITLPSANPASSDDSDASLDDADALPAVGKVWDSGPKRSLSSMFAAAKPKEPQSAGAGAPAAISAELQTQWQAVLQSISDQMGPAVHVPLASGDPRRENGTFIIRFAGPFANLARLLEKHKDSIQRTIGQVTGEALPLVLEVDASAPAPKAMPQLQPAAGTPGGAGGAGATATGPATASIMATPPKEGIPLTPELRAQLEKDPLIRSVLEGFNGNIVKVE